MRRFAPDPLNSLAFFIFCVAGSEWDGKKRNFTSNW